MKAFSAKLKHIYGPNLPASPKMGRGFRTFGSNPSAVHSWSLLRRDVIYRAQRGHGDAPRRTKTEDTAGTEWIPRAISGFNVRELSLISPDPHPQNSSPVTTIY